jgi:Protein of unknown function (DUF3014)
MPDDPSDRDLRDEPDPEPDPHRDLDERGDAGGHRLDDLEIAPTARLDDARPDAVGPREGLLPVVLVGAAVIGIAVLAAMFFLLRNPVKPRTGVATAPSAPLATASPSPALPLPTLDESDSLARSLGGTLSSHPEFSRWLARTGLVRTLAAVVTNVADGESPRPHLEFLAPAVRFRARTGGVRGPLVPDPAGFAGYDGFGDAVASVDARAAASAYRAIEPLLDAAHRELGHPEGRFRDSLDRATAALLAVPVLPEDAALAAHATVLRYADPAIESLTPAQKQLLRTGPRNVRLVQAKLRELQTALGAVPPPR